MKTIKLCVTTAAALLLSTLTFPLAAQTSGTVSPTSQKPITHRARAGSSQHGGAKAAAQSDAIKLPASIPQAKGLVRTEYALRYIDVVVGTGAPAAPGLIYSVHYTGWLYDGTKFDSSVDRGTPIQFRQGQHRVILGWDSGFEGMKVGGKRRLFIPWELAYGEAASGPIPARANLIFDVELVKVEDPSATKPNSTPSQ